MSRWTAVSDYDYLAEGQDPPAAILRACSVCGEFYEVERDDSFVLQPLCDRCLGQSLDRAMADRQKARTKMNGRWVQVVPPADGAGAVLGAAFKAIEKAATDISDEIGEAETPAAAMAIHARLHEATMTLMHLSTLAITRAMETT